MQQSQSKPEAEPEPTCVCGRARSEAVASSYRSYVAEFVFHRCPCGLEWTERRDGIDRSAPVSMDEVIEVHQCLAAFEGPLSQLVEAPRA
jgi:hypothetical protein